MMTIEEIRKGAPSGATDYIMKNDTVLYYLKQENGVWMVYFSYDSMQGWGYADQKTIVNNIHQIKTL